MRQPNLIPTSVACKELGVDRTTISRWVAAKRLTPTLRGPGPNGAFWFDAAEVERMRADLAASKSA